MPILVPVPGAEESPSSEVVYAALGSIDVINSLDAYAENSIDILSEGQWQGYESIDVSADGTYKSDSSIRVGNFQTDVNYQSADVVAGDSFLVLVDLLSQALSGPNLGSFGFYEINARLLVNGVAVAIKSFRYEVPTGRLGSVLNVVLADPTVAAVPAGADVDFSLIVRVNGVESILPLIANGKLQQRDYTISYQGGNNAGPKDEVTFSSLDVIADKFGLAPRRPVVMFDPQRVRYDDVNTKVEQCVRDSNGRPILPVLEPVVGLTMRTILSRAYSNIGSIVTALGNGYPINPSWAYLVGASNQQGVGLTGFVTNIPDYRVRRADFTLEGGWHDGAQPCVAMYAPVYFVENNVLFIMDTDFPLPNGINAHVLTLAVHKSLSERIEYKPDANAVLLTYQYNGNDPYEDPQRFVREVLTETIDEAEGLIQGQSGYYKITTRRRDKEYYMSDAPTVVLDTLPVSSNVETSQTISWYDEDGIEHITGTRLTHQETIDYLYEGDLKIRHIRETKAAVADPTSSFQVNLIVVEREVCEISWTDDPINPGVKLQDRVRIDITGRCAYDPDNTETIEDEFGPTDFVRMIPILLSQASGIISDTWVITDMIPIKSIRQTLQNMKGNQYDVEVIEIDHINNTHKRSYTEPTTGSVANDPYEAKSRTILLRDTVSEAEIGPRIPVPVNAYELPRIRAIQLGQRVLHRLNNPLMAMPISLAGVDFAIARGSVIKGQKRTGYSSNYFVTGYSINGDNLGKKGHRISQTLEATELLTP